MKSRLSKGLSMLLCLAMVLTMVPVSQVFATETDADIAYQGGLIGVIPETETPELTDKYNLTSANKEISTLTTTWGDFTEVNNIKKYQYADFSCFVSEDGKWIEPTNKTYTISSAEQLAGLMVIVNADAGTTIQDKNGKEFSIEEQKSFSGYTIKLANDIDLGSYEWVSIGNDNDHAFSANFDGANHVIKNMKIDLKATLRDCQYAGFIGYYNGNSVSNITIGEGSSIYANGDDLSLMYIGGVIGIAEISGENTKLQITNCVNNVTITILYEDCFNVYTYVGGIMGFASIFDSATIIFTNCENYGKIVNASYAGGIVGCTHGDAKINSCSNKAEIKTGNKEQLSVNVMIGGIVGYYENWDIGKDKLDITNCHNYSDLTCIAAECVSMGGIIGKLYFNSLIEKPVFTISNCSNSKTITGDGDGLILGGIIGEFENMGARIYIKGCKNNGIIQCVDEVPTYGFINLGGFIGRAYLSNPGIVIFGSINGQTNENTGDISGEVLLNKSSAEVSYVCLGGFIGFGSGNILLNKVCKNTGKIINKCKNIEVETDDYIARYQK